MIGFIWICALGLHADPLPINWTHLIGRASLNTEKLEQVLYRKRPSISLNRGMEFPDAGHDLVTET